MINQKYLAEFIETKLNTRLDELNDYTKSIVFRFRLIADVGEYLDYEYLTKSGTSWVTTPNQTDKVVKYINTFFSAVGSTVEGVDEYEYTYRTALAFMIPILTLEKKTKYNKVVDLIQTVVNDEFKQNSEGSYTIGTTTYHFGVLNSLCTTGSREQRGVIGDSVELDSYIDFYFVQDGLNSSKVKLYIDGSLTTSGGTTTATPYLIPSTRIGFNRISSSKSVQKSDASSEVSKHIPTSTVFALNFDMPARLNNIDTIIRGFLFDGTNAIHYVEIKIETGENTYETHDYYMRFDSSSFATEQATFASCGAKLVEAEILDNAELSDYAYYKKTNTIRS